MKIAVIGTGNVGSALASGWQKAGHQVLLGVRDPKKFKGQELLEVEKFSVCSPTEAAQQADCIVLAIPPKNILELKTVLEGAADKIIIDPTNSFPEPPQGFSNCSEAIKELSSSPHVIKAFNNTGFQNMHNPQGIDTFMASDSSEAKKIVQQLAQDLGFANCYDFGGAQQAGLQEQLAICWINLALFQGMGTDIGINIVRK